MKIGFKLDNKEDGEELLKTIFFFDEYCSREIFPEELTAFFNFKDQIEMMGESGFECSFLEVVESAKELQKEFKKCLKAFKVTQQKGRV